MVNMVKNLPYASIDVFSNDDLGVQSPSKSIVI